MTELTCDEILTKDADEKRRIRVNFTPALNGGTIASVMSVTADGLTITEAAVIEEETEFECGAAAPGNAIRFMVEGGTSHKSYRIKCRVVLDDGQIVVVYCLLDVEDA